MTAQRWTAHLTLKLHFWGPCQTMLMEKKQVMSFVGSNHQVDGVFPSGGVTKIDITKIFTNLILSYSTPFISTLYLLASEK